VKNTKPAPLTSALLSHKGGASTLGFFPAGHGMIGDVMSAHPLATRPSGPSPSPSVRQSIVLDRDRHNRLKLAATKLGSSARQLMVNALDHYLATVVPARLGADCRCLQPRRAHFDAGAQPACKGEPEPAP